MRPLYRWCRLCRTVLRVRARVTDRPFYFGIEQTELNLWKFDKIPSAGARNHKQNDGMRRRACIRWKRNKMQKREIFLPSRRPRLGTTDPLLCPLCPCPNAGYWRLERSLLGMIRPPDVVCTFIMSQRNPPDPRSTSARTLVCLETNSTCLIP